MTRSIVTASVIDMENEELTLHLLRIRFAGVVSVNLCLRWIPVYRHETMKNVITTIAQYNLGSNLLEVRGGVSPLTHP